MVIESWNGRKFYFNPSWRMDYNHYRLQNSIHYIAAAAFTALVFARGKNTFFHYSLAVHRAKWDLKWN